jgi:hypothetical protein
MKPQQKLSPVLICLAILITIAIITVTGCVDAGQEQQSQATSTSNQPGEHPAAATIKTTTAPAVPLKTAQPTSAPGLSTAGIAIAPISDKKVGDQFTLTATTSLPAGTNLFWQILPDTGTPPNGLDKYSTMSVGGNNQVTKGDGTLNRISQAVNLGRLVPGKYVVIVGEMKGDFSDFEIGDRYGYTYFTLS